VAATVIDVVVVDDHPAVLAGLVGLLESEPGLACVAAVTSAADALNAVRESGAAVVVADYELRQADGVTLCADLKALAAPPGVIIYSAFARPRLLPAAAIAGADAMLDKAASADELFDTIRAVAHGAARLPTPPPEVMERCFKSLNTDDLPLFGMAVNGAPANEIAAVIGADLDETERRLRALLGRLQEQPPAPAASGR
jgi:DNA-binding NarL/FixJ family response regulator